MKISLANLYSMWDDDATFAEMQAATGLSVNALVHELIKAGTRPYPGLLKTASGRAEFCKAYLASDSMVKLSRDFDIMPAHLPAWVHVLGLPSVRARYDLHEYIMVYNGWYVARKTKGEIDMHCRLNDGRAHSIINGLNKVIGSRDQTIRIELPVGEAANELAYRMAKRISDGAHVRDCLLGEYGTVSPDAPYVMLDMRTIDKGQKG